MNFTNDCNFVHKDSLEARISMSRVFLYIFYNEFHVYFHKRIFHFNSSGISDLPRYSLHILCNNFLVALLMQQLFQNNESCVI